MQDGKNYLNVLLYVFLIFASLIIALTGAYFGSVGLFFGQSVVEVDVMEDKYKYKCKTYNTTTDECDEFSEEELDSYVAYKDNTNDINDKLSSFLSSVTIVFSLLALVFLFLALHSSGIIGGKGKKQEKIKM